MSKGTLDIKPAARPSLPAGQCHLLAIAIDDYTEAPLYNCVSDAEAVAKALQTHYGFSTDHIRFLRNNASPCKRPAMSSSWWTPALRAAFLPIKTPQTEPSAIPTPPSATSRVGPSPPGARNLFPMGSRAKKAPLPKNCCYTSKKMGAKCSPPAPHC